MLCSSFFEAHNVMFRHPLLIIGLLIGFSDLSLGKNPEFGITTESLFPEHSATFRSYRHGIVHLIRSKTVFEFSLYSGERIFFLFLNDKTENPFFSVGIQGGIILGLTSRNVFDEWQMDTVDGYYGLVTDLKFGNWGIGFEWNHHSAHFGDSRFQNRHTQFFVMNFFTLRAVFLLTTAISVQSRIHFFHQDDSRPRTVSLELEILFQLLKWLRIEAMVQFSNTSHSFDRLRVKLSAFKGTHHKMRCVPYILFHHGTTFFLRRYPQRLTIFLVGMEFDL